MIPKIIHYCWFGHNPKPALAEKCMKSWRRFCHDYEIIEWNEDNFSIADAPLYVRQAYEAKKWAFVTDYVRLYAVAKCGGVYLDTDVELIKSYDPLLKYEGFAGFESETEIAIGLGFGAEKDNPYIVKLRDSYNDLSFVNPDGSLNLTPAPLLHSKVLQESGARLDGSYQKLDGFVLLPMEYLCPKSFVDGILQTTEKTYSIHHYEGSWLSKEQQNNKNTRWKQKKRRAREKKIRGGIHKVVAAVIGEKRYKKMRGVDHDGAKSE